MGLLSSRERITWTERCQRESKTQHRTSLIFFFQQKEFVLSFRFIHPLSVRVHWQHSQGLVKEKALSFNGTNLKMGECPASCERTQKYAQNRAKIQDCFAGTREVATLILTGLFTEGKEGLQKSNQLISNGLHPRMNQVTLI